MASMAERKVESINKEIEKLQKSLERNEARLTKKTEAAVKVNANWTEDEWFGGKRESSTAEQRMAYLDLSMARDEVNDLQRRIANAKSRLAKATGEAESTIAERASAERVSKMDSSIWTAKAMTAEEFEAWLTGFKAECLKDGVQIETYRGWRITGKTKGGKSFGLHLNNGSTNRSMHCYTLYIGGEMIFTSGEFGTAYAMLKR